MTKLPENMKPLFWDVDFETLDFDEYKEFIAARILNYGTYEDLRYLFSNIKKEFLIDLVKTSRELDDLTRNFWRMIYDIK
jgi:hypothetical protein